MTTRDTAEGTYTFHGIRLPDELKASIDRYVSAGIPTGGFLQACIENDLREAVGRADHINMHALPAVIGYLYNDCPMNCWGRKGIFKEWIERKREERKCQRVGASLESTLEASIEMVRERKVERG